MIENKKVIEVHTTRTEVINKTCYSDKNHKNRHRSSYDPSIIT